MSYEDIALHRDDRKEYRDHIRHKDKIDLTVKDSDTLDLLIAFMEGFLEWHKDYLFFFFLPQSI